MIDVAEKKEKILGFLKASGPSIPVRIARAIEMDPIFASAILSELINSRDVVLSHMRIGSSPFYLLPGDEKRLEEHVENLRPIEKDAYLALRKSVTLYDDVQPPAFRIALRSIRDFSKPFNYGAKMVWRYAFSSEEEVENSLGKKNPAVKQKEETNEPKVREKPKEIAKEKVELPEKEVARKTPVKIAEQKKKEDIFSEPEKCSDLFEEVQKFLKNKSLEFIERIQEDKKEIAGIVKMKTPLGDFRFLLIAKNKKNTSKDEVKSAIQRSLHSKMPCLFLLRKEPSKSIRDLLEENKNLIKLEVF